ncbi:MAG TPA: MFS transporter [Pseudogracilibacillus sp.]|nr:MFS transporter [Pseudogracilibacillus sp.]
MVAKTKEKIWTKDFISLALTQLILFTVFYSLLTTLPIYVIDKLGGTQANAGLIVTFMLASAIIVRPFSAKILDIVGKKRTLVLSVGAFALTTFFYLFMNEFVSLLILRFIHGISFSIVTTASSAIAADIVPKSRKGAGMGYFAMSMNLAIVIGPFIGLSLLQFISFDIYFIVLSILMVISFLCTLIVRIEERERVEKVTLAIRFKDLIEPKAIPIALISGLVGVAYASILSFVPVYAEAIGLATTASYFFLVFAIVMIAFRPYLGRAFDEKGPRYVLIPSLLIFAAGLIVLGFTETSLVLLIAAGLIGLGYGTLLPGFQTVAIQKSDSHRSGHAISTFFIFYDLGIALGAFVWGIIVGGFGYEAMYFTGAGLMIVTTVILYRLLTRHLNRQKS